MKEKYKLHEDFKILQRLKLNKIGSMKLTPFKIRLINLFVKMSCIFIRHHKNIKVTTQVILSYKSGKIKLTIYEPKYNDSRIPCLLFFHGSAFIFHELSYMHKLASRYAYSAQCKVIFVHYRLAPKYPFPYSIEDGYNTLIWAYNNSKDLGIDKDRVAVCGDSAGGAIAAALTHMTRDRNGPEICAQMLIYPVIDEERTSQSMRELSDFMGWNPRLNKEMWNYYLKDGDKGILGYAAPISNDNFKQLPKAYIEVEELDCFRDEGIAYAKKLKESGNIVELNYIKGTFHGFDIMQRSIVTQKAIEGRVDFLKKSFYNNS